MLYCRCWFRPDRGIDDPEGKIVKVAGQVVKGLSLDEAGVKLHRVRDPTLEEKLGRLTA